MSDQDRGFWAGKCRERTATCLCDSGHAYGYMWQRPPIDPDTEPEVLWERPHRYYRDSADRVSWDSPTISTSWYLSQWVDVDEDLNRKWDAWQNEHGESDRTYMEEVALFLQTVDPDLEQVLSGNTYNEENTLSQDFWYRVFGPNDSSRDSCYSQDDSIIVLSTHTGCDARYGYTTPVFCRPATDYAIPTDICAGLYVVEARRPWRVKYRIPATLFEHHGIEEAPYEEGPDTLDREECQALDETWQPGYSSYPMGQFEDQVKRVFTWTYNEKEHTICVLLKNGILARVGPQTPYLS
jgi:hypothetical protein